MDVQTLRCGPGGTECASPAAAVVAQPPPESLGRASIVLPRSSPSLLDRSCWRHDRRPRRSHDCSERIPVVHNNGASAGR